MLGVFAEFETCAASANLKECRCEGTRVYKGRRATINPTQVKRMKANGVGPFTIAKTLKIGRALDYRAPAA